jgi:hypothetical protein
VKRRSVQESVRQIHVRQSSYGVHDGEACVASLAGKNLPRLLFVPFSGVFSHLPTSLEHVHDSHACENAKPLLIWLPMARKYILIASFCRYRGRNCL